METGRQKESELGYKGRNVVETNADMLIETVVDEVWRLTQRDEGVSTPMRMRRITSSVVSRISLHKPFFLQSKWILNLF